MSWSINWYNPEPKVNETINEKLDIVEEQITGKHLLDEMILNLIKAGVGSDHSSESE